MKSDDEFENKVESNRQEFIEQLAKKEKTLRDHFEIKVKEHDLKMKQAEESLAKTGLKLKQELDDMKKKLEQDEKEYELTIQRTAAVNNSAKKGKTIF